MSASASCWRVAFSRRSPSAASAAGASFPGDQGVQEPPPAGPEQVGDHHRDLQQRVLEDLLDPVLVPDLVLGQPGPGPGQRPQVPDRLRGGTNERRSIPRSFSLHSHTLSARSDLPRPGRCFTSLALTSHTSRPSRLGQVIPDPPVIGGALEHQPLDALAPQVIHQRDHRAVAGLHLPHLLPLAVRPAAPAPGCTPSPTPWRHRSRPRTSPPRRAPRPPPRRHRRLAAAAAPARGTVLLLVLPSGHRRLASLDREPAGEAARGAAQGKPNLIGVLEATVPSPHDRPQRQTYYPGTRHQGANGVTGSTPRSCPLRTRPPPPHQPGTSPGRIQAGHRAHPPAPRNRSRRRQAHGQHTHRQKARPVTTRTRPATHVSREPHAAKTQRLIRAIRGRGTR